MFSLKNVDKENLHTVFQSDEGKMLFRIIVNFLANTTDLYNELKDIDESIFSNEEEYEKYSKLIIDYMWQFTEEPSSVKIYTTGEMSKYFGVSVSTINNWINEGRFVGLPPKEKNKQVRISENIKWRSSSGELMLVKDIVTDYEVEPFTEAEWIDNMKETVQHFEAEYGGKYEDTLKLKVEKDHRDEANEREWMYLLRTLKEIGQL